MSSLICRLLGHKWSKIMLKSRLEEHTYPAKYRKCFRCGGVEFLAFPPREGDVFVGGF